MLGVTSMRWIEGWTTSLLFRKQVECDIMFSCDDDWNGGDGGHGGFLVCHRHVGFMSWGRGMGKGGWAVFVEKARSSLFCFDCMSMDRKVVWATSCTDQKSMSATFFYGFCQHFFCMDFVCMRKLSLFSVCSNYATSDGTLPTP